MEWILETITVISLLFMVMIYIRFWMMRKQIERMDIILGQFHEMFFNAYQVVTESELNQIMNDAAPSSNDNREEIKEWDEGN